MKNMLGHLVLAVAVAVLLVASELAAPSANCVKDMKQKLL